MAGRGAVVVGGSRGIGLAVAELLAQLGASVVVNGRDADAVAVAAERISGVAHAGSPADPAVADALIDCCVGEFGHVDILVNCAGYPRAAGFVDPRSAPRHGVRDVPGGGGQDGRSGRRCDREHQLVRISRRLRRHRLSGREGGVNGLIMAIAAELKEHGVRANVVCPGAKTRLSTGPAYEAQIADLHRRGLLDETSTQGALDAAPPEYVASTYGYLVSTSQGRHGPNLHRRGFVGRFDRPPPSVIGYRDHHDAPPWSIDELHELIG